MDTNKEASVIHGLVREILQVADRTRSGKAAPANNLERRFNTVVHGDYIRQLSRHFSHRELRSLLAAFTNAVPNLNREQNRDISLRDLGNVASRLGADFKASPFPGRDGLSLRGFYAEGGQIIRRPLICVNSLHHPLAVATTFWHEVGHHLISARLSGERREAATLSFANDYDEHLEDALEIAADMVVSLGGYPRPVAERLFAAALRSDRLPDLQEIVSKTRSYLRAEAGFEFDKGYSAGENLHYLAGMIHFVKLRLALLMEYDV